MGQVTWVEVLGRSGEVAHRHRCAASEFVVGRGYDCDVIVDDPYVAPRHLRVFRDEGGALAVEDLSAVNGMAVGRAGRKAARAALDDGIVRIGRTTLRIRDADHAVAPERALVPRRREWPAVLGLIVAILAIEVVSRWLNGVGAFQPLRLASPLLGICAVVLGWSAVWSVLTRIFAGQMRFERNLLIAAAGLLTYSVLDEILGVLPFMMSWTAVVRYEFVGMWIILAAVCILHLREFGPSRLRLKGGAVAAIALAGIAMQFLGQQDLRALVPATQTVRLLPPALRLAPPQPESAFFADVGEIKTALDGDRAKAPAESAVSAGEDD